MRELCYRVCIFSTSPVSGSFARLAQGQPKSFQAQCETILFFFLFCFFFLIFAQALPAIGPRKETEMKARIRNRRKQSARVAFACRANEYIHSARDVLR